MITTTHKLYGLDVEINIPETQEEAGVLRPLLASCKVVALDTETVGLESEKLFKKANKIKSTIAFHENKLSELDALINKLGRRTKATTNLRAYKKGFSKKLARALKACASLESEANQHPGGLHFWENKLGCIQIGFRISDCSFKTFLFRPELLDLSMLNAKKVLIHNAKFDYKMLKVHKHYDTEFELFDTMIAEYLLLNGKRKRTNLDQTVKRRVGIKLVKDKKVRVSNWGGEWSEGMIIYAALDVVLPFFLYDQQLEELKQTGDLFTIFKQECELIPATVSMEMQGIGIDVKATRKLLAKKKAERQEALQKCVQLLGINPDLPAASQTRILNSPKELLGLLSMALGVPLDSTEVKALRPYKDREEVQALTEYRKITKLISTYLEPFIKRAIPQDDGSFKIYGELNQTRTETGRYSSEDPNLQNMPATEEFRNLIIPRPGHVFVCGDLSSIEPRILAHVTGDPILVNAFRDGKDVYKVCCQFVYGVSYDNVTKEMRSTSKAIILGLIYGKSPYGLAMDLEIDVTEAAKLINQFFKALLLTRRWLENLKVKSAKIGFVETVDGRRRYLPDINSLDKAKQKKAEREIGNTVIQGTAAGAMKRSIAVAFQLSQLPKYKKCRLLLTIHDELLVEVPDEPLWVERGKELLMIALVDGTSSLITKVPVKVGSEETNWEPSVIKAWGEMKAA